MTANRIIRRLLLAAAIMVAAGAAAQSPAIRIGRSEATVMQIIEAIESQTDFQTSYNKHSLDPERRITLPATEMTLDELLTCITRGAAVRTVRTGRYIAFIPQRETPPSPTPQTMAKHVPGAPASMPSLRIAIPQAISSPARADIKFSHTDISGVFAPERRLPLLAVKSNLLYGSATLTPNIAVEAALAPHSTVELAYSNNPWHYKARENSNRKLLHGAVRAEYRYWLRERFTGHFFGAHAIYGEYNVSGHTVPTMFDKQHRYHGTTVGGGVSWGYALPLGVHWRAEFEVGAGVLQMRYDRFSCLACDRNAEAMRKTWVGPTALGVNLVYVIGGATPRKAIHLRPTIDAARREPLIKASIETETTTETPTETPAEKPTETTARHESFVVPESRYDTLQPVGNDRSGALRIYFRTGSSTLDPHYMYNEQALGKLTAALHELAPRHVTVAGFASPEGGVAANDRLSEQRAEAIKSYILSHTALPAQRVDTRGLGEDWDGLRAMVEQSTLPDKREILRIIDTVPVWDARTKTGRQSQLMLLGGGRTWRNLLSEYFPWLRSGAFIKVYYNDK